MSTDADQSGTRPDAGERGERPRLVVGIGASAGGLDPCKRLVAGVPRDRGIALIVVMHLDPNRASRIAELLQGSTSLHVVEVTEEHLVRPDCVYVIAPDSSLEMRKGVLFRGPRRASTGVPKPIDALFSSLAEEPEARTVAVVLSGSGDDGSSGLRDVHARGGLCIAQDPNTAEFDSMPRQAIDTGVIDHVLSPDEIAPILIEYANQPDAIGRGQARSARSHNAFDRILDRLGDTFGVNFRRSYKRGTLERRTDRRMGLKQVSDHESYLELLTVDSGEVVALYRDLLIGVTAFFRDPEVWQELESAVLPGFLAQRRGEGLIKVWVPGCATGEEAYTLAIILLEQLERIDQPLRLQVFASDVAETALGIARRGLYPADIADAVGAARLERFFHRRGDEYEINREVREAVTFAVHNLLADPPFSRLDLLSCRNVLIYLEAHAQQRALESFHFALEPGGLLLLGASESVGRHAVLFEEVSRKCRIYRSTAASRDSRYRRLHLDAASHRVPAPRGAALASPKGPNVSRVIEHLVLSRYTWACVAVTEAFEIHAFFGRTQDYLERPTGEARMDILAWAKPGIYPRLRSALERARTTGKAVTVTDMRIDRDGTTQLVECTIEPMTPVPGEAHMFLVVFRDALQPPTERQAAAGSHEPLVRELEVELKATRSELQSAVEQLDDTNEEYRASHEELLSLNEELQSNNEELESSKEELQALNEEMNTVNRQLDDKNLELRATNADLQNLLLSTDIPAIFLDRDLRVRRFTPAATELMRLVPSDVGRSVEHVKARFQDDHLVDDARRVLDKLSPIETEVQTEGGRFYARRILPYRTEDDRIDGVCLTFHDVTERKHAERAVEEARLYAEAIVATVQVPLLILDHELRVVSANACYYEAFGVEPAETVGVEVFRLGNQQWDIPRLRSLLLTVLPEGGVVRDFEVDHDFEGLGHREMRVNALRMGLGDGPAMILMSIADVTAERRAERVTKAREHDLVGEHRRKDEFLAMLGHELRNPLSAMVHGLDLLGLVADDRARREHIRAMMMRQAMRIRAMLDQLLDVGRLTAGKIQIARVPVDMVEAVQAGAEAVAPVVDARGHTLRLSVPPEGEAVVAGDLGRLTQVVENLLSNAAKYTEDGGKIDLVLESDARFVRLRVRDTGVGIDSDLLPHVFELFTQAPRSLDRAAGGLGLGLPLVERIVELHGGTVTAASPGRGEGSEFVVTLPRLRGARGTLRTDGAQAADIAPHRILVVDDEVDGATMLADLLAARGHASLAVHDGPAAIEAVHTFRPDVVLLDLGLPGIDGYEVARRIRDETPRQAILIIAVTGYQRDDLRLERAGFDRHLIKPPDVEVLSRWLAEHDAKAGRSSG